MRVVVLLLACGLCPLAAQTAAPASPIDEAHAREVVTFLASDELAGRDTPSRSKISRVSSARAPRWSQGMPIASNSSCIQPTPTPMIARPSER